MPSQHASPAREKLSLFHAYSLKRMRKMATVVLVLGLAEYLLLLAARAHLPQPIEHGLVHTGLIGVLGVLAFLMSRVQTADQFGLVGVAYASLIELGFVLSGRGTDDVVSWVLPAVMLVPLAGGSLWLTRVQFIIGTVLCWLIALVVMSFYHMSAQELIMIKVYFVMNVTLATILHVIFYGYRLQTFTLEQFLASQASLDSLTGVLNRGSFVSQAGALIAEYDRRGLGSSMLYMDLDRFKEVNDNHGHAAGDDLLRKTATLLSLSMRDRDLFGRLGGEEFAMLVATTSERDAIDMAERLRAEVKCIERPDGVLSISIGIAHTQPGETLNSLLQRADSAMLLAKRKGRDRVECA